MLSSLYLYTIRYNGVSLGFFILAVALLDRQQVLLGSVSFSLALNYKQMELYHAMPFFVYILGLYMHKNEGLLTRFVLICVACRFYRLTE